MSAYLGLYGYLTVPARQGYARPPIARITSDSDEGYLDPPGLRDRRKTRNA